ncbi:hypothetical protein ABZ547_08520 [Streptomyces sparsogenes]
MSRPLARLTAECIAALAVCWGTAAGLIALGHRIQHPKGDQ